MHLFSSDEQQEKEIQDVDLFDEVRVVDPKVFHLCMTTGQTFPYQILLECIKQNYGMGSTDIYHEMRNLTHRKKEFIMSVGEHTTSVICRNKWIGKQWASQFLLQEIHPHVMWWGSLLQMYDVGSPQTLNKKKVEKQQITKLQACANNPSESVVQKMKKEMLKFKTKEVEEQQMIEQQACANNPSGSVLNKLKEEMLKYKLNVIEEQQMIEQQNCANNPSRPVLNKLKEEMLKYKARRNP